MVVGDVGRCRRALSVQTTSGYADDDDDDDDEQFRRQSTRVSDVDISHLACICLFFSSLFFYDTLRSHRIALQRVVLAC
jgi:hypothetical protein